jgi:hydrocephalus-inducing protein
MASYAGIFSAVVENGDQEPKTHKLIFDLKGDGALPTIKVEKPKEFADERTILIKYPKTRIGKACVQSISLKNEGSLPATTKFELTHNDHFKFIDSNSLTLSPKAYGIFNIEFKPKEAGLKQWEITANTLLNQFECYRFKIEGEAYNEDILF